ncbi:uncharacterized protein FYN12_001995 [Phoenicopterus ruber ruber]
MRCNPKLQSRVYHGGLIALDIHGNITVYVSTSGPPFKHPGRLGDPSSPGCGLQMHARLSFGIYPASRRRNVFEAGIIAMNMKGETGAASSVSFPYCGWSQENDCIDELVQQPSQPWKNTSYKKIHR